MTCGWDGHEHPRGTRVVIDQARQLGANLVTYLLGSFQLGRFLSSTKVYYEAEAPSRDDFVFAQMMHEGDWDPDPSAVHNLLKFARDNSTLEVKFKRQNVRLKDPKAVTYPLLYMTGHREFAWSAEEAAMLQKYLKAGGIAGGRRVLRPDRLRHWRSAARSPRFSPTSGWRSCRPTIPCTAATTRSARSNTRPACARISALRTRRNSKESRSTGDWR